MAGVEEAPSLSGSSSVSVTRRVLRTVRIDDFVLCDPDEPARQSASLGVEPFTGLPSRQKDLLGYLRTNLGSQGAFAEGEHQRPVLVVGLSQRGVVSLSELSSNAARPLVGRKIHGCMVSQASKNQFAAHRFVRRWGALVGRRSITRFFVSGYRFGCTGEELVVSGCG